MNAQKNISDTEIKMHKVLQYTLHEFSTLHTGKASPSMLDSIQVTVQAYGSASSSIKDLATLSTPDARTIQIQPWDKSTLQDIKRAIEKANLGFNPVVDSNIIRINIPELSGDRRKELVKIANSMAEEGRIRIRNIRRETLETLKQAQKEATISEDELKRYEKEIQEKTDENIKTIGENLSHKEKKLSII